MTENQHVKNKNKNDHVVAVKRRKTNDLRVMSFILPEKPPKIENLSQLIDIAQRDNIVVPNINMIALHKILPQLIELQSMIGMQNVKETMFLQILYYLQGLHFGKNSDYLHTIITGEPGSGKTTVAMILGKIYKNLGILSHDSKFITATRSSFIGKYLGQTATKTLDLLKSADGGVLFCDELYSLGSGNKDHDSYSKEAIDTIINYLSENKSTFSFIGAGYSSEIEKCFFSLNPGLRRRFPWIHDIPKYSTPELAQILRFRLKEIEWYTNMTDPELEELIRTNKDIFEFQGGSIETFITKCKIVHSKRMFGLDREMLFCITKEDTKNAIELIEKLNPKKEDNYSHMYL